MAIDIKNMNLQEMLGKELTRKQFLQVVALLIVSVLGFNNLLTLLSKSRTHSVIHTVSQDGQHGFGSSKFGA